MWKFEQEAALSKVEKYEPKKPYILKSGKRKGRSLEQLMFQEPWYVQNLFRMIQKKKKKGSVPNELEKHLNWLRERASNLLTEKIIFDCPQCNRNRKVKFFGIVTTADGLDFMVSPALTACEKAECRSKLKQRYFPSTKVRVYRLKWSSIFIFRTKEGQRRVVRLFKFLLGFRDRKLSQDKAFEIFANLK